MRISSSRWAFALAGFCLLLAASSAWASGATFAITGQGIALGEAKEDREPPVFAAKAVVGQPFTLTAQGMVLPRGGKAQPGEPDAGAWSFDVKQFKRLPDANADKTKVVVRVEPTMPGTARLRFTGTILGYERTFDVVVEVIEKK